jgi:cardiolipin synthase
MSRSLVVLPDDSAKSILDAIHHAAKSLRVKMFVFTDPSLIAAVIQAHRRGVNVRIMLNPRRRSGVSENDESRSTLQAAGIDVLDSNPAFDLTHEKSMVVDDKVARGSGDHQLFRSRLEPPGFRLRQERAVDLVPRKWPRTDYRVH